MARLIDLALRDTTQARDVRRPRRSAASSSPPAARRVQE